MNMKALITLLALAACPCFAQPKVFMLDAVHSRNAQQQWQESLKTDEDCVAYFSDTEISMNIDRLYHLSIVSTNQFTNDGTVYLCKDQNGRKITITLIDNDRMFVYDGDKRMMVEFEKTGIPATATASIAHAEE